MSVVRLLDLVEQHHAVRVGAHGIDEQAALLEADVSGRGADEPGHGVLLHVLAHVEADELVAEENRELLGELRLADAGRAGEEEAARRADRAAPSPARARLIACATRCTASSCPNTTRSSDSSSVRSRSRSDDVACRCRDARHARDDRARCRARPRRVASRRGSASSRCRLCRRMRRERLERMTAPASSMRSMALSGRR